MGYDYIFVYGTLRRGADTVMSRLLSQHANFVDTATYRAHLYKVNGYPGVVPSNDPNDKVQGDVYQIHHADVILPLLDHYEEVGLGFPEPNEYTRRKQTVLLNNGCAIEAWVYIYNHPTEGLELIRPGNFIQQTP
jgi:gamma-glutamylcyclotransferase (GGCT)/AIG2-like uncharacterized protein YtfP